MWLIMANCRGIDLDRPKTRNCSDLCKCGETVEFGLGSFQRQRNKLRGWYTGNAQAVPLTGLGFVHFSILVWKDRKFLNILQ